MAIDWTKPLQLIDGTPVKLEPHDPKEDAAHTNGPNGAPDSEGDYWITGEFDGIRLRGYASLCVSADGTEDGEPLICNREARGTTDGRKRLRATWPPRKINCIRVELDEVLYAKMYEGAKASGMSLAEYVREQLK